MADKTKAMGGNLVKQAVIDLVVALLLCILVARIGVGRKRDTALTLALAALAAGILKELSDWNWYGFSASYAAVNLIDLAIQFSLAGIVIAWLYKREMRGVPVASGAASVR
jgi:general stress protein CsbA